MTTQLHNTGEQFETEYLNGDATKPTSVDVGLYHDGEVSGDTTNGDDLADADDVAAITTEPTDGNYGRTTVTFDNTEWQVVQDGSGNYAIENVNTIGFDLTDTTGEIDAYVVVVNFDAGGGGADHIWFTGNLSQHYTDLSQLTSFDLDPGAVGRSVD